MSRIKYHILEDVVSVILLKLSFRESSLSCPFEKLIKETHTLKCVVALVFLIFKKHNALDIQKYINKHSLVFYKGEKRLYNLEK